MEKIKFTETEVEMLEQMVDLPDAYNLTDIGIKTITTIYNKVKEINSE